MRVTHASYAANALAGLLLLVAVVLLPAGPVFAAYDVTISGNSSANGAWSGTSPDVWTPSGIGANVSVAEIRARLNGGINVEITTAGAGSAAGNIDVDAVTSWNAGVLTLTAQNDITINAIMTVSTPAGLSMNYGAQGGIKVGLAPGEAQGFVGRVDFPGRSGNGFLSINGENYTVISTLGMEGSTTALDLQGVSGNLAGKYALGADIDAFATAAGWNQNSGFEPVGDNSTPFIGVFDGLGHTINGLKIDRSYDKWVGLFGYTATTAVLRNTGLAGGSVNGQDNVGGLAGYAAGVVSNCYNSGMRVDGSDTVGGLVGINSASITESYSTGTVNGTIAPGGLVGDNLDGSISNSYAKGNVIGTDYVGGLVGYNSGILFNSYARGIVFGNKQVGGLVGRNDLGFVLSDISGSYATGFVNGTTDVGGLVGWNDDLISVTGSFWDTLTSNQTISDGGTGKSTAEMKQLATFVAADWDISATEGSTSIWRMIEGQTYPLLRRFVPPLSTAISDAATSITTTSATLNGTVNARYADTTVRFEYGPTTAYGTSLAAFPASVSVGSGDTAVTVSISGLTPGQTYHYRVVASNSLGTVYGSDAVVVADKVMATVTLGDLNHIFDGSAKNASAVTNPSGKTVLITYNGSATLPTNAGSYAVIGTISDSYYQGSATGTLTIAKAAATVTLTGLSQTYDGSAKPVTATTTPAGLSTSITYDGSAIAPTAAGSYTVAATITAANYSGSATGTLIIAKATPTVTWAAPPALYLGSTLTATQLNASATVPGAFVYTPAAGTVMNTVGSNSLSVVFTPSDTANYNSVTAGTSITINEKLNPVITWATPAAITYGSALSATQLNAAASVAGTFSYSPASAIVLGAGTHILSVVFTPSDAVTYKSASASVTLTITKAAATVVLGNLSQTYNGGAKFAAAVTTPAGLSTTITYNGSETAPTVAGSYPVVATINDANYSGSASGSLTIAKATPSVIWAAPAAIYIGSTLTGIQLNATANVGGSFVYTPAAGTVMNSAGAQTLSAVFTPADALNYNNASASTSITINNKLNPVITWATPAAITYGSAISAAQLNATASVAGTFSYTPASGAVLGAGSQTLTVTFTPADAITYNTATKTVSLTLNKATATVSLSGLSVTYDGNAKVVSATTNPAGKAVGITYSGSSIAPTAAGSYAVVATINDANYSGSATGTLTIAKATPVISWAAPAAIYLGSALSPTQLNAATSVPGAFVYTPAAGTVMNSVGFKTLSAAFTPADAVNYNIASASTSITVNNKLTPTVTWANPAAITYGTALSASQLNATATVPGSFVYTPAAGVLNSGSQTLSAVFTPTDAITYATVTKNVILTVNKATATVTLTGLSTTYNGLAKAVSATTIPAGKTVDITYAGSSNAPVAAGSYAVSATVNDANYSGSAGGSLTIAKATPVITWTAPAAIYLGSTLGPTQLNAVASVPGAFVYTPTAGTAMNSVGARTLSAAFTPADAANYNIATASTSITVNSKLNPIITWANPAAITYGAPLSVTQLNATANVPGAFTYSPAIDTRLNAGTTQTLSVTFTPTDTITYNTVSKSVTINVSKATASIALTGLTTTYDGSVKPVTASTTPPGLTVSITYAGSSTAPAAAGSYPVVATISDANYIGNLSGTLTIAKATPSVIWAAPAAMYLGSALTSSQLNASATVPGTLAYIPTAGTVMNTVGSNNLSAVFTPADTVNYNSVTANRSITVNSRQVPTVTWATPAAITYGTVLSATQLNATASVAGTFAYSPASGVLNAGTQTLSVTFTPTDPVTYTTVTKTVSLTVNKAAATVTLSGLSATYNGSAKAVSVVTNPAGKAVVITYTGVTTAPTAAGNYAIVATVSDVNYSGSASGTLTIAKATPLITWTAPAAMYLDSTLGPTQLNAAASVPGAFVYTPAAGTVMNSVGARTLSAAFTPADAVNYNNASASTSLTVSNKLTPVITWANPAPITYGTALSASQLNATATIPGSFAYTPAAGVLNSGSQTLSVVFTPTDAVTYTTVTKNVILTVNKATATVTLAGLSATYNGLAKAVTATTTPADKTVAITYDGSITVPSTAGSYAVVATIIDANYSGSAGGTLVIALPSLTVAVTANGTQATGIGGTVTSSPAGISCNTSAGGGPVVICTNSFSGTVDLYATPSALSIFGGWGGACSGLAACSVTMDGNKTVTATFNQATLLHIDGTPYSSLQAAYNAANEGAVIQMLDNTVAGILDANRSVTVKLKGGYNTGYSSNTGITAVSVPLTLRLGTVEIDRIVIK